MAGFLDIYIKLIIAVLSFIAPITIYLLSVEGLDLTRKITGEQERQIALLKKITPPTHNAKVKKTMRIGDKGMDKMVKKNKRLTNLLNPERQMYRIFVTLTGALAFQMFYYLSADKTFMPDYYHGFTTVFFFLSLVSFVMAVSVFHQIAQAIIYSKKLVSDLNSNESL
ncbi:hypothetical protein [Mucilaginibacter sp. HD30]